MFFCVVFCTTPAHGGQFHEFGALAFRVGVAVVFQSDHVCVCAVLVAEHVFVALRVHEYEMADVHCADAGDFDGALRAVFVVYREDVADRDVEHFGEPFGDYRAIVDQYLWLVCFAVA